MSCALLLPGCPQTLPDLAAPYSSLNCPELPALNDWAPLQAIFATLTSRPTYLLGSEQTPSLVWLLASQAFPKAKCYYFFSHSQHWQALSPAQTTKPEAQRSANVHTAFHACNDSALIAKAFTLAAWGYLTAENQRQLEELVFEAQQRAVNNKNLPSKVAQARTNGQHAYDLAQQLKQRIKQGQTDHSLWISQRCAGLHSRIEHHLNIELNKHLKYQQQRASVIHTHASDVRPPSLINGHHPNSLRHLAPAAHWQVLIDETGLHFDADAEHLSNGDKTLGRLVALVIPDRVKLPEEPNFHATSSSSQAVDLMVQQIIEHQLGVFGFTVKDPALNSLGWISMTQQMVRWVLLQLPIQPGQAVRVECLIEQRSSYQDSQTLQVMSEVLENECKRLDPERFAHLKLSIAFINKHHPLVGYVDSAAFTWGSPSAVSQDRLKKTAWLGHCLLQPDERALSRLLLLINPQGRLPASDWYDLCAATLVEPTGGLFSSYLYKLGQRVTHTPEQWMQYLEYVRLRLANKDYRLPELAQALAWLQQWQPSGQTLPGMLRLLLSSAHLSLDNHQGHIDLKRLNECIQLSKQLKDEDAQQSCAALLRIASATTNSFEFDLLQPLVKQWLEEPIALVGLLNHGKLHSSFGQLLAFSRQHQTANVHFEQANACFQRLSDPAQARREQLQTRNYYFFNQLSLADPNVATELCQHLQALLSKPDAPSVSRSLAHNSHSRRYEHHLWLRAMLTFPEQLASAREAYLEQRAQWQSAPEHPWPLIDMYRAWLLQEQQPAVAATTLQLAITHCSQSENGPILHWMAEVLRTLGYALTLNVECPSEIQRKALQERLPHAPHAALTSFATQPPPLSRTDCLTALARCLPFTLH